ncbi:MAG TPA: hypothetical protein DCS93_24225 [Microscillaceae bacterium]|nr:hypothetical protein [Microscillaceae bacterium]
MLSASTNHQEQASTNIDAVQKQATTQNTRKSSQIRAKQRLVSSKHTTIQAKQRPIKSKQAVVQAKQKPIGRNNGLPSTLKTNLEQWSGIDLSDVTVHKNSSKPLQLQAAAYAQGNQIYLGPGQEKHLAHEAVHVVQQKQGRVQSTTQQANDVALNDDPALEKEADQMGAKASQTGNQVNTQPSDRPQQILRKAVVQRQVVQRVVKTWGGEWKTDLYKKKQIGHNRGLDIKLLFTPNQKASKTLIGLTQTVQTFRNDAPENETSKGKHPASILIDKDEAQPSTMPIPDKKFTDQGTHIDQYPHEDNRNPLYAVDKVPKGDKKLDDCPMSVISMTKKGKKKNVP